MTSISGYSMIATTCCHTLYSTPRFRSMNFSAWAHWTDGHQEGALMHSSGGLRKCKCGDFYLLSETVSLGFDAEPDTPHTQHIEAVDLAHAVRSKNKAVELVARRQYWMFLNHGYRDKYREHKDAEAKASQEKWTSDWHAANPNKNLVWNKLTDWIMRRKPAGPPPMLDKPFSVPSYQPTQLQIENMALLLELILDGHHEKYGPDMLEVAELYREQGHFNAATKALNQCPENDRGTPNKVMQQMIEEAVIAPVRYRM